VGLEVTEPIINAAALAANVTNEGGVYGTYRLLKNVMGLWIIQQCRATWQARGQTYSYIKLTQLAGDAPPLRSVIDPNDLRFLPPGDHPHEVQTWCAEHGQPVPETHGAIIRCVLESLALAYREVLETLQALSGRIVDVIHILGGGTQNELLSQMTANASGIPVLAGPIEATVIGNVLVQLIALGELSDIAEGRQIVARMGDPSPGSGQVLKRYEPQDAPLWEEAYRRYREL
jgi:rhamnulokinase